MAARVLKDITFPIYALPKGETYILDGFRMVDTDLGTRVVHPPLEGRSVAAARLRRATDTEGKKIPYVHLRPVFHYTELFAKTCKYITAEGEVFRYKKSESYPIKYRKILEHGPCRADGYYIEAFGYACRFRTKWPPEEFPAAYAKFVETKYGPILLTLCERIGTDKRLVL